jgi:predicted nucleotidyltransferase
MLTSSLPEGSKAYVFGSFTRSAEPRDFDLLIVYDSKICAPSKAYKFHEEFLIQLRQQLPLRLDVTLLTQEESCSSRFIERTGAIPFERIAIHRSCSALG